VIRIACSHPCWKGEAQKKELGIDRRIKRRKGWLEMAQVIQKEMPEGVEEGLKGFAICLDNTGIWYAFADEDNMTDLLQKVETGNESYYVLK